MDNTLYIALSHQAALRRRLDVVANNIANMNTTAFQKETVAFHEYVMNVDTKDGTNMGGLSFVEDKGVTFDFREGEFISTNNDLDVAISGQGFFSVLSPDGEVRYTRNGHFSLNQDGFLATDSNDLILDDSGAEIQLTANDTQLTIAPDGTISSESRRIAKLAVSQFNNLSQLKKSGLGLFETDEAPAPAEKFKVSQGMLENSNVNAIEEMTNLIAVQRSYERTSKMINSVHELRGASIKRLGSIK